MRIAQAENQVRRWGLAAFLPLLLGAAAPETNILDTEAGCIPPARYVAPNDIRADAGEDPGVAANLPGTANSVGLPDTVQFPLFVDPLPLSSSGEKSGGRQPGLSAAERAGSSLYLGEVAFNRQTRDVSIDGTQLSDPAASEPCTPQR